jgi:protein disulfide-isomerase A6
LYNQGGPVVILTKENWQQEVIKGDSLWLIEFYAPWCGHCKNLAPEWTKAAKQLKGVVKVGAVDMTEHQEVGAPYNVQGFPTLKFFGFDKKNPVAYESGRDADSIVKFALDKVKSEVNGRGKGGKSSSSSGSGGSGNGGKKADGSDVLALTDSTFDSTIYGSKDIWMVEFYAPWCGHCKALEPEWNQAAADLKGKVRFAKVDATENESLARRFGVQGYPTIKYFDYGKKSSPSDAKPFEGGRDAAAIKAFASDLLNKADIEPDLFELINQKVYDDNC